MEEGIGWLLFFSVLWLVTEVQLYRASRVEIGALKRCEESEKRLRSGFRAYRRTLQTTADKSYTLRC